MTPEELIQHWRTEAKYSTTKRADGLRQAANELERYLTIPEGAGGQDDDQDST